uniref:RAN binding protein 3 n=1 Tax=Ictidomys tridecemlineatus TaxID=43179 RepID=A0A287DCA8_ICTTR
EKPAIAPPVFVFQKDKGQKSSAEQKDLSDSGEEPQGEAEAPHHGTGHPESAGEHALEPPAPASTSASTPSLPAPEAQLPFPRELAGNSEELWLPLEEESSSPSHVARLVLFGLWLDGELLVHIQSRKKKSPSFVPFLFVL